MRCAYACGRSSADVVYDTFEIIKRARPAAQPRTLVPRLRRLTRPVAVCAAALASCVCAGYSVDEYVWASVGLYLDILNLFLRLLEILGMARSSD
jgi:FtsH-binding integral membrane protein